MMEIKYTILYCVNFCDSLIKLRFQYRSGKKLQFRFRFRNNDLATQIFAKIVVYEAVRKSSYDRNLLPGGKFYSHSSAQRAAKHDDFVSGEIHPRVQVV